MQHTFAGALAKPNGRIGTFVGRPLHSLELASPDTDSMSAAEICGLRHKFVAVVDYYCGRSDGRLELREKARIA